MLLVQVWPGAGFFVIFLSLPLPSHAFSLPSQRNFPISFKPKVAIAKFVWKMQKKVWYYEKWVGRQASFSQISSVKLLLANHANSSKALLLCGFFIICRWIWKEDGNGQKWWTKVPIFAKLCQPQSYRVSYIGLEYFIVTIFFDQKIMPFR